MSVDRRAGALKALAPLLRGFADLCEAMAESEPATGAQLLRLNAAAQRLACHRATVSRLIQRGALRGVMVGTGSPRVTAASVDELIENGGLKTARRRRPGLLEEITKGRA